MMPQMRSFMMGEFKAEFPDNLLYAKNHMWAMSMGDRMRFGFAAYAVRLLQDVYFLDWDLEVGVDVRVQQEIGSIESKKAESSLYSPIAGNIVAINQQLLEDPSSINVDKYESGWLMEIAGDGDALLTVGQYVDLLDSVWQETQRAIKGQMN